MYRRYGILFLFFVCVSFHLNAQLVPFRDSTSALYGYKNAENQVIVAPQYAMANAFSDGLAAVNKGAVVTNVNANGGKWGFIDSTGKEVIPLQYDFVQDFRSDTAHVIKDRKRLLIDKAGKIIDPTKYYSITTFDTPIDWQKKN